MKQTIANDLLMRGIKIIDIGYITVIYMLLAILCAFITDKILRKFDEKKHKQKSKTRLTVELIYELWLFGILIYIIRNVVQLIPFPLDGYHGFEHKRLRELKNASLFSFTYFLFSDYLKNKIKFFYNHVIWDYKFM